jgi:hypothetical protein
MTPVMSPSPCLPGLEQAAHSERSVVPSENRIPSCGVPWTMRYASDSDFPCYQMAASAGRAYGAAGVCRRVDA